MTGLAGIAGMLIAFGGWLALAGARRAERPKSGTAAQARPVRWAAAGRRRIAVAAGIAVVVGIVTRWPVAGLLAGLASYAAPALLMMGGAEMRAQAKLEAIASWVEVMRGEIRAYAGVEQAIRGTAGMAKAPIAVQVRDLADALEGGVRLRVAITAFRRDVDHPAADLVGISLVKAATTHTGNLADQLGDLVQTVRDDVAARERIQISQTEARTSARLVILIVAAVGVGLYLFNRSMLPLGTVTGQLVLAVVSGMWAAAGLWLHRLATTPPAPRVFKTPDEVAP
ncbi:type II secretion system F family protein [Micromonospora sp. WMMD1082]|uniref:type II secretion system F family protein n=1 Tax=Micromonospora sp. WMMD1082 TaxID=3016104 RepID=UPI0024170F7F|nr:type II secretion system F family protein [Micromonospora sp. WMMD1082]MDG4795437.1 pilus assembly protein TadB [Micromonospora sp. WMMD1082]